MSMSISELTLFWTNIVKETILLKVGGISAHCVRSIQLTSEIFIHVSCEKLTPDQEAILGLVDWNIHLSPNENSLAGCLFLLNL